MMSGTFQIVNFEVSVAILELQFETQYLNDQLLCPIMKHRRGDYPLNMVQADRLSRYVSSFCVRKKFLYYKDRICVPSKYVRDMLQIAHDSKVVDHFEFAKI